MSEIQFKIVGDGYECTKEYTYYSRRYNRYITVPIGFYSDGATDAPDLDTDAWWVHDKICRHGHWDDGTRITNWQASVVLKDILVKDGYTFRAPFWCIATYLIGGGAARRGVCF